MTTTHIMAATRYILWVKKRDQEGKMRWYPKRKISRNYSLVYDQAMIDYGEDGFFLFPEGMKPLDEWIVEAQPETKRDTLYSVWTEGKDGGVNKQRIGEHLNQEEAQHLKALTEASPMALGLRVWVETES